MIETIQSNLKKIIETCKEMQVQSLFLFGSGARVYDFTEQSDLDFLFRFKKNKEGLPVSNYDYFDLLFRLQEITGRKIDLVAEEKIRNQYFMERVNSEKVCIYEV